MCPNLPFAHNSEPTTQLTLKVGFNCDSVSTYHAAAPETQAPAFPVLNSSDNCPDLMDSCLPQMKSCRLVKVPPKMSGPKMSTFTAPWTL